MELNFHHSKVSDGCFHSAEQVQRSLECHSSFVQWEREHASALVQLTAIPAGAAKPSQLAWIQEQRVGGGECVAPSTAAGGGCSQSKPAPLVLHQLKLHGDSFFVAAQVCKHLQQGHPTVHRSAGSPSYIGTD